MISLRRMYEQVFSSTKVKSVKKTSSPPENDDGEIVSVEAENEKGKDKTIVVKPQDDEPVIIRRKGS